MVDLVQTPANVQSSAGVGTQKKNAGAAITAGDSLFIATDGDVEPAQHDVDAASAQCVGIALNDAAVGQPVIYQVTGDINVGATLVVGETYVVGAGPGSIAPVADIGTGDFSTIIGVAISASTLRMGILPSGVARA